MGAGRGGAARRGGRSAWDSLRNRAAPGSQSPARLSPAHRGRRALRSSRRAGECRSPAGRRAPRPGFCFLPTRRGPSAQALRFSVPAKPTLGTSEARTVEDVSSAPRLCRGCPSQFCPLGSGTRPRNGPAAEWGARPEG